MLKDHPTNQNEWKEENKKTVNESLDESKKKMKEEEEKAAIGVYLKKWRCRFSVEAIPTLGYLEQIDISKSINSMI